MEFYIKAPLKAKLYAASKWKIPCFCFNPSLTGRYHPEIKQIKYSYNNLLSPDWREQLKSFILLEIYLRVERKGGLCWVMSPVTVTGGNEGEIAEKPGDKTRGHTQPSSQQTTV